MATRNIKPCGITDNGKPETLHETAVRTHPERKTDAIILPESAFRDTEKPVPPPQTALSAMRKRLSCNARKALPHCRKDGSDIHGARNSLSCKTLRKHVIFPIFRHKTLFFHGKRTPARLVFNILPFMCKISHAWDIRIWRKEEPHRT